MKRFHGNFTQQEPIAEDAIAAAVEVLRAGRIHRYNVAPGETSIVSLLEAEYAAYQNAHFCLACASGGYAMSISLRAAGLEQGAPVLTNAFTLAPVPGAITAAGGQPVLVEITEDLVIDIEDLLRKIDETGARILLLSNMRGHLADMESLQILLEENKVTLIEDCAHTMGATWNGIKSGNFGIAGCFSTQTYKHMNSGEGGLITSHDPAFMARAVMLSGSYMHYERHGAAPDKSYFEAVRLETPNMSGRMDNLRAAILRPQIRSLDNNIARWNERYGVIEHRLRAIPQVALPERPSAERYVGSSIQFRLPGISEPDALRFVRANLDFGVELKWFGSDTPIAFTSNHHSWQYIPRQTLAKTDEVLSSLFDMRIPLTFTVGDCEHIADIVSHCVDEIMTERV